jgi:DHA1 family bicyclomycin/chloramphenicol resistance-like MFS transporter
LSAPLSAAQRRRLPYLLAALTAVGPFAIDAYLPSFHAIGTELHATPVEVQQTLSAFLLPFAIMMLWHGALSDALGRRRVLLAGTLLFALASLACVWVDSIAALWLLRAAQGVSAGAGMIVGRAIVRDVYDDVEARRLMSQVAMMFALAPAIAPVIGGVLQAHFGWRSVFLLLAALALTVAAACWRWLPETLPPARRQSLHPASLWVAYRGVLTDRIFLAAAAALSLNFAGFFIYVLSAPIFLMRHLGLPETAFAWLFLPSTAGLLAGSFLAGRLAGKQTPLRSIGLGYALMGSAAAGNIALNLAALPSIAAIPWQILPLPLYTCGMALTMPNLTLLALDRFPQRRGLAASCQAFMQTGFNTVAASVIAPLLWATTLRLSLGMALLLAGGGLACLAYRQFAERPALPANTR